MSFITDDALFPLFLQVRYVLLTRGPRRITDIGNLVKPLPIIAWCLMLLAFFLATIYVLVAHQIYILLPDQRNEFVMKGIRPGEIVLKMVGSLTEPERFPYFVTWSSGQCLT